MLASKKTTRYLFYAYLLLLSWGILFKFETQFEYIQFFMNNRPINWVPFSEPVMVNGDIEYAEMVYNVLFFLPMGVCLPVVAPKWSWKKIIATGFLLSLFYECLQFVLAIGIADITDVITNTLGVALGLLVYQLFLQFFSTKTLPVINVIGIIFVGIPLAILLVFVVIGLL